MKILIADENSAVRYGLAALLEEQNNVRIVGEAANFKDLLRQVLEGCPDLILLSWELPGKNGESLMVSVRLICPQVLIVVMSSRSGVAERALELGADDFISKAEPPERLLDVIHRYLSAGVNTSQ
jgi:DNA-binding NarL/FixJ family response regulator